MEMMTDTANYMALFDTTDYPTFFDPSTSIYAHLFPPAESDSTDNSWPYRDPVSRVPITSEVVLEDLHHPDPPELINRLPYSSDVQAHVQAPVRTPVQVHVQPPLQVHVQAPVQTPEQLQYVSRGGSLHPEPAQPASAPQYPPRNRAHRAYQACEQCQHLKVKCYEERPTCAHCQDKGLPCVYPDFITRTKEREVADSLAALTERVEQFMEEGSSQHDKIDHFLDQQEILDRRLRALEMRVQGLQTLRGQVRGRS